MKNKRILFNPLKIMRFDDAGLETIPENQNSE